MMVDIYLYLSKYLVHIIKKKKKKTTQLCRNFQSLAFFFVDFHVASIQIGDHLEFSAYSFLVRLTVNVSF